MFGCQLVEREKQPQTPRCGTKTNGTDYRSRTREHLRRRSKYLTNPSGCLLDLTTSRVSGDTDVMSPCVGRPRTTSQR